MSALESHLELENARIMCGLPKDPGLNRVPLSSIENLPPILVSLFGDPADMIHLIDTHHLGMGGF
jgi:hypothetical protein